MPALPEKDVKKFLNKDAQAGEEGKREKSGNNKTQNSESDKATPSENKTSRTRRTNVGGRWYNNNLDGANDLKSNKDIA